MVLFECQSLQITGHRHHKTATESDTTGRCHTKQSQKRKGQQLSGKLVLQGNGHLWVTSWYTETFSRETGIKPVDAGWPLSVFLLGKLRRWKNYFLLGKLVISVKNFQCNSNFIFQFSQGICSEVFANNFNAILQVESIKLDWNRRFWSVVITDYKPANQDQRTLTSTNIENQSSAMHQIYFSSCTSNAYIFRSLSWIPFPFTKAGC